MAVGKREAKQESLWIATADFAKSPGHPFYEKLNGVLREAGFDLEHSDLAQAANLCVSLPGEGGVEENA